MGKKFFQTVAMASIGYMGLIACNMCVNAELPPVLLSNATNCEGFCKAIVSNEQGFKEVKEASQKLVELCRQERNVNVDRPGNLQGNVSLSFADERDNRNEEACLKKCTSFSIKCEDFIGRQGSNPWHYD